MTARFCSLGLMNLSSLADNHRDMVAYKAYEVLIEIASGAPRKWYTLNSSGVALELDFTPEEIERWEDEQDQKREEMLALAQSRMALAGMTGDVTEAPGLDLALLNGQVEMEAKAIEPQSPRAKSDYQFIQQYGYDREARRYAVLAIGNLAVSPLSHGPLMQEHCIAALNHCLDSPDDETRFNAAFALNKLAMEEANIAYIGNSGVIPRLVDLLITGEVDSVAQATAVLRHLAMLPENRLMMLAANLIDPLSKTAQSTDKETLREVATMCCLMSLTDALRLPMVASSLLTPLTALCNSDDVEIARQSCGALANLSENKRAHKRLATTAKAMHHMVGDRSHRRT